MHVTLGYKLRLFIAFAVAYAVFYVYPNFFIQSAVQLPLWPIDQAVPFVPWTFLVYTSDYILILSAIYMFQPMDRFHSYARMCFATLFIAGMFFFFFPTEYPRPVYPDVENRIVNFWMNLVGKADTPRNCFPSMHVALTTVATWNLRFKGPRVFGIYVVWSLAIFISTLTTKQHYFSDILGGLLVAGLVGLADWLVFQRGSIRLPFRKIPRAGL